MRFQGKGIRAVLTVLTVAFFILHMMPRGAEAALDVVEIFDSDAFLVKRDVYASDSAVFIRAFDGISAGGTFLANVTDEAFGDLILVWLYDDGNGPGDAPNDGFYTGSFTVIDDEGFSGQYTDDVLDILDLRDRGLASIVVDLDLIGDSGFATITADFKEPAVNITSPSETVDLYYTLTATVSDINPDTNAVWYTVDGGPNRQMAWLGADRYEAMVDTSNLIDGSHTLRVVAYDLVNNVNNSQIVVIDVYHPAPDISISFTVTPTEPRAGDRVEFEITIDNSGDADADDVRVTLLVDGDPVDETTQTVGAGQTEIVTLHWNATEGTHDVEVEVSDGGIRLASTPLQPLEIGEAEYNILNDPMLYGVLWVIFAVVIIGGTVAGAYYGKELIIGQKKPSVPAEEVPAVPPGEEDPCEETRRKWRTIVAEHERAKSEMMDAESRAASLAERAIQARRQFENAESDAEEANKNLVSGKKELDELKERMHDFFEQGVDEEGISVGYPKEGQREHIDFFKDLVKVYVRTLEQERTLNDFLEGNRKPYEELQEDYDEAEESLNDLKKDAASANRKALEAEIAARNADKEAKQAEHEYNALKHEVKNLETNAEVFRQRWRMCMLKRLEEAVGRAETASGDASESLRKAREATSMEQYEEASEEVRSARERTGQAKEDAEGIKQKMRDEDIEEDTSVHEERIDRANSDAMSALEKVRELGSRFVPKDFRI